MAKKKKGKVVQMLSPENYIRKKARTLPIYECWVNEDWEEHGLAHIMVTRKHTNGNITCGLFLVDLKCIGVKDAHYMFNISEHNYREYLEDTEDNMDLNSISYTLAHNIIFAGIEFAEEYGFKPHKDFTSFVQYILEEDTDDIELMEIECGVDGKPAYFRGPDESDADVKKIIAQLEREAGPGNYSFFDEKSDDNDEILDGDDDEWDTGDWEDDDILNGDKWDDMKIDEQEKKFEGLSTGKKLNLIKKMVARMNKLTLEEREDLGFLINSILNKYIDFDKVDKFYEQLSKQLLEIKITGEISDEILGIETNPEIDRMEWEEQFLMIYKLSFDRPRVARKKIKRLHGKMPDNPAIYFLELTSFKIKETSDYNIRLNRYYSMFPNYPLIKMLWYTQKYITDNSSDVSDLFRIKLKEFFPGKKLISTIEMFNYLTMLTIVAAKKSDMTLLEVLDWIIEEIENPELENSGLTELITMFRFDFLLSLKE